MDSFSIFESRANSPNNQTNNQTANQTVTDRSIDTFLKLYPNLVKIDGMNVVIDESSTNRNNQLTAQSNNQSNNHIALLSGGGDGHWPAHLGLIGRGCLTGVASGQLFASPSISQVISLIHATKQSNVLLIVKQYTGDLLNFGCAMERTNNQSKNVAMLVVGDDCALPRNQQYQSTAQSQSTDQSSNQSNSQTSDQADSPPRLTGRRGVAGTVFIHKMLGAMVDRSNNQSNNQTISLQELQSFGQTVASRLVSISCGFSDALIPSNNQSNDQRIKPGMFEIGVGIHGEEGAFKGHLTDSQSNKQSNNEFHSIDSIIDKMLEHLLSHESDRDYFWREAADQSDQSNNQSNNETSIHVALLVNNLHGMTGPEMSIVADIAITKLQSIASQSIVIDRVIVGELMSASHMRGFTLTLLRLPSNQSNNQSLSHSRDFYLSLIDHPTDAPGWVKPLQGVNEIKTLSTNQSINQPNNQSTARSNNQSISASMKRGCELIINACNQLIEQSNDLNRLDASAGDGDTGNSIKALAERLIDRLSPISKLPEQSTNHPIRSLKPVPPHIAAREAEQQSNNQSAIALIDIMRDVTTEIGGTLGAIFAIIMTRASSSIHQSIKQSNTGPTSPLICRGMLDGIDSLQQYAGTRLNDRTMIDALVPALNAYSEAIKQSNDQSIKQSINQAAEAAEKGAESTATMKARAGRASYVQSDQSNQQVDAGARAIAIIVRSMADTIAKWND